MPNGFLLVGVSVTLGTTQQPSEVLLEDGSGSILLEDGSGVLLIE